MLPSLMCIGLGGSVEKVLVKDWTMRNVCNQAIIVVDGYKRVSLVVVCQYFSWLYLISPASTCGDLDSPTIAQRSLTSTTL